MCIQSRIRQKSSRSFSTEIIVTVSTTQEDELMNIAYASRRIGVSLIRVLLVEDSQAEAAKNGGSKNGV